MLTDSVCIASNTRATMNTLQTVASIPAFKAGRLTLSSCKKQRTRSAT
jgi:hypothetical protein